MSSEIFIYRTLHKDGVEFSILKWDTPALKVPGEIPAWQPYRHPVGENRS